MTRIDRIDPNLAVPGNAGDTPLLFRDARSEAFRLYGLQYNDIMERYQRMPTDVAEATNPGVLELHIYTAGGRLHLRTNSRHICLQAEFGPIGKTPSIPLTGLAGFDMYRKTEHRWEYETTFSPPYQFEGRMDNLYTRETDEMADFLLNFPTYGTVNSLRIGLDPDAVLEAPAGYRYETPVIYYGSSITQGASASRPGNCFEAMLTRELDCDHVNLGFSGNGKLEAMMADYIASLPMSVFVMTCFFNTPLDVFTQRYPAFYERFRAARPDVPYIFYTAPLFRPVQTQDVMARINLVRGTYEKALASGDRRVWYVDGRDVRRYAGGDGSVDGIHPNDLGFRAMAEELRETLAAALRGETV